MVGQSKGWYQREGTVGWWCVRPCYMEASVIVHRPHIKVGIKWRRRSITCTKFMPGIMLFIALIRATFFVVSNFTSFTVRSFLTGLSSSSSFSYNHNNNALTSTSINKQITLQSLHGMMQQHKLTRQCPSWSRIITFQYSLFIKQNNTAMALDHKTVQYWSATKITLQVQYPVAITKSTLELMSICNRAISQRNGLYISTHMLLKIDYVVVGSKWYFACMLRSVLTTLLIFLFYKF